MVKSHGKKQRARQKAARTGAELPEPGPAGAGPSATVTFTGGPAITVYGPELHRPAMAWSGGEGYAEFSGYISPGRHDGIAWPTTSAHIDQPGREPYAVTDAHVDISGYGGRMNFLKLVWRTDRPLPSMTQNLETQA